MSDPLGAPPNEKELLLAILDLPPDKRAKFIERSCGKNLKLKNRIEALVRNAATDGDFLAPPGFVLNDSTALDSIALGQHIDRYKLMEQIGEGGMGVVYVAEQSEPVRRRVALKIIKPGMDSKQVIARFEAERQALALMDHPNIARVLDAGTTQQKLPYFVMELVRGLPITKFCDQAKLTTRQRLELFTSVCSAIHHAHQKGIIHRDIKPSNILVTLHDGTPVVKVIDFGVAKALHQGLSANTIYTALNQVIGTPLYMSPEQLELSGLDVDTRTDIYALGVLLYELITGTTPFESDRLLKSGFDEMRRIIREEDPPKPSQRISSLEKSKLSTTAGLRGLDERRYARSLQGELDWITLKALEKDRNRRYDSASSLGADVKRFLQDEPVLACPPSLIYRMRKTVRRHRSVLAVVGLVWVALFSGLTVAFWQLRRALAAEKVAENAVVALEEKAQLAEQRLEIAERAVGEMYTQFANEWLSQQSGLTDVQRRFLEKAVETYEQLAQSNDGDTVPRLAAVEASYRLGLIYGRLGLTEEALNSTLQALELATRLTDAQPDNVDATLQLIQAQSSLAFHYRSASRVADKIRMADEAMANAQRIDANQLKKPAQRDALAKSYSNIASVLASESSRQELATEAAEMGVAEAQRLVAENPEDIDYQLRLASCYSAQGTQLLWFGKHNDACAAAYEQCLSVLAEVEQKQPGSERVLSMYITPLNNLAMLLGQLKRDLEIPAIRQRQEDVLESLCARFPDILDYQSKLAVLLRSMAGAEKQAGNLEQANRLQIRSLEILQKVVDRTPNDPVPNKTLLLLLQTMAEDYKKADDLPKSIETLERAKARLLKFMSSNPEEREFYSIASHLLRKLTQTYLGEGAVDGAASTLEAMLKTHTRSIELDQRGTGRLPLKDYRSVTLTYLQLAKLYEYCSATASSRTNGPVSDQLSDSEKFERRAREMRDLAVRYARDAAALAADTSEPLSTFVGWADSSKSYETHSRPESLEFVLENALVESAALIFDEYLQQLASPTVLPVDLPGTLLLMASSSDYSRQANLLVEVSQRMLENTPGDATAEQAYAWVLLRNSAWQSCVNVLERESQKNNAENGFVRAMAMWHLEKYDLAREELSRATEWMEDNRKILTERRVSATASMHANIETLGRLKSEAEQIILLVNTDATDATGETFD